MEVDTSEDCMGNFYLFWHVCCVSAMADSHLQQTKSSPDGFVCVAIEATSSTTMRISMNF